MSAIPQAQIDAVRARVAPVIRDLIDFQLATGARPGEAVALRACDLKMPADGPWEYRVAPEVNKTEHLGRPRIVFVGPAAQAILRPRLTSDLSAPLFASQSKRWAGRAFTVSGYRQAIQTACDEVAVEHLERAAPELHAAVSAARQRVRRLETEVLRARARVDRRRKQTGDFDALKAELTKARAEAERALSEAVAEADGPKRWHPHQLRHNAGERFEVEHGIEVAQYLLGHRKPDMTRVYSDAHLVRAAAAAAKTG